MSLGGGGGGAMEQLQQQLQLLEQEKQAIRGAIQSTRDEQAEIDEAIEAIETGSTVQVPVGGGAYVRAEIADIEEVVVGLGGGYAAERDSDGAIDSLETKKDALDDRIDELEAEIDEVDAESDELEARAQQMQQQQMQQLQQQMQQQGDE